MPLDADFCPACGIPRSPAGLADSAESIAALLYTMEKWRADGLINETSFARLQYHYQRRLATLSQSNPVPSPISETPATLATHPALSTTIPEGIQPRQSMPPPPSFAISEWAARRQADVLLYVGAFLLVVSALIFVTGRGEDFPGILQVALLATYTAGFIVAGLRFRHWQRIREAGPIFLAIGALITPLNFVLLHTAVLSDQDISGAWIWFGGSSYSAIFYGALVARRLSRLYAIPAASALFSAWGSLAVALDLPGGWWSAWWMAFVLVAVAAIELTRNWRPVVVLPVVAIATLSTLFAHFAAALALHGFDQHWQLPATYALLLAAVLVSHRTIRLPWTLIAGTVLATITAVTVLWSSQLDPQWFTAPPLIAALLAIFTRPFWSELSARLSHCAWLLAAGMALSPLLLLPHHLGGNAIGGTAAFFGIAAVLAALAWRNQSDGILTPNWSDRSPTPEIERIGFAWLSWPVLLVAFAFAQRALEVDRSDTGWVFAALAFVASLTMIVLAPRWSNSLPAIIPPLLLATAVSIQPDGRLAGHNTTLFALPVAQLLIGLVLLRRWTLAVISVVLAFAALAFLWDWQDWPLWRLSVLYSVVGLQLFAGLTPLRRYRLLSGNDERTVAVQLLSWVTPVVAILTAALAVFLRVDETTIEAATTVEYRTLVLIVLQLVPMFVFECWRFRRWEPSLIALAVIVACLAAVWPIFDWPYWTLAVTYSLAGLAAFTALTPWIQYRADDSQSRSILILSWAGVVIGPLVALGALGNPLETLDANAATLVEFRTLTALILLASVPVTFDAYRLGVRWAYLPASTLVMVSVELAIGTQEPGNVQAHTIPAAIYLAAVGLTARSTQPLSPNLGWHEVLQLVGSALLIIPQIEQGFGPGSARWGIILLVESAALLAVALALSARWLGVSAVLTISGVAIRFLWERHAVVPYWLMLAVAGLLLLGIGIAVLLQRDWWDRNRARLQDWWERTATLQAAGRYEVPVGALLTTLAPASVIFIVADL
jgi:hypothetical protein